MNDKIIERIKKMFALATNEGAAPGEAENAMRMANKLMEKYNLSVLDLHTQEEITIKFGEKAHNTWKKLLYVAIAEVYGCVVFFDNKKPTIAGTLSDATTAKIIAESLISSITRKGKGKNVAFHNGAVQEIMKQCRQIIEDRRKDFEKIPGTELILADIYDTKLAKANEKMREMVNTKLSTVRYSGSSAEGRAYGRTLNPHARVNGSGQRALN